MLIAVLTTCLDAPTNKLLQIAASELEYPITFSDPTQQSLSQVPDLVINRCNGTIDAERDIEEGMRLRNLGSIVLNCPQHHLLQRNKVFQKRSLEALSKKLIPWATPVNWQELGNGPFVVKNALSCGGKGMELLSDRKQLELYVDDRKQKKDCSFVIENYQEIEKEWRVLVVNQRVLGVVEKVCCETKQAQNTDPVLVTHNLENTNFVRSDFPEHFLQESLTLTRKLNLTMAAIDWVQIKGEVMVLEINLAPGLVGMHQAYGDKIIRDFLGALTPLTLRSRQLL